MKSAFCLQITTLGRPECCHRAEGKLEFWHRERIHLGSGSTSAGKYEDGKDEDGRHNQGHFTLQLLLKQHLERMCGKANFQLKPISNAGRIGGSSLNYQKWLSRYYKDEMENISLQHCQKPSLFPLMLYVKRRSTERSHSQNAPSKDGS